MSMHPPRPIRFPALFATRQTGPRFLLLPEVPRRPFSVGIQEGSYFRVQNTDKRNSKPVPSLALQGVPTPSSPTGSRALRSLVEFIRELSPPSGLPLR
jgi:hypothetical protein